MWNSGQRRHHPVVGGQLHPPREPLAGHHVRAMRLRHQLRASGRPGGRDQHDRVVLARGTGATRCWPSSANSPASGIDAAPETPAECRHLVVGDDNTRLDLRGEPGQLGLAAARIGGDHDGADVADGQPGEQVLRERSAAPSAPDRRGRRRTPRARRPPCRSARGPARTCTSRPRTAARPCRACRRPRRRTGGGSCGSPVRRHHRRAGWRPPQPGCGCGSASRRPAPSRSATPSPPPAGTAGPGCGRDRPAPPSRRRPAAAAGRGAGRRCAARRARRPPARRPTVRHRAAPTAPPSSPPPRPARRRFARRWPARSRARPAPSR